MTWEEDGMESDVLLKKHRGGEEMKEDLGDLSPASMHICGKYDLHIHPQISSQNGINAKGCKQPKDLVSSLITRKEAPGRLFVLQNLFCFYAPSLVLGGGLS